MHAQGSIFCKFVLIETLKQIGQVVRVLNIHLHQLRWIDDNAAILQAKVHAAQKATNSMGSNGNQGNSAVDAFGRSFMGRR